MPATTLRNQILTLGASKSLASALSSTYQQCFCISEEKSQTYASTTSNTTLVTAHSRGTTVEEAVAIILGIWLVVDVDRWVAIWVPQESDLNVVTSASSLDSLRVPGVVVVVLASAREIYTAIAAVEVSNIDDAGRDTALREATGRGQACITEAQGACESLRILSAFLAV